LYDIWALKCIFPVLHYYTVIIRLLAQNVETGQPSGQLSGQETGNTTRTGQTCRSNWM